MSKEVTSPYLDVFEPNTIDKSITEFEYIEYQQRDGSQMNKGDGGVYTIETHDNDVYLLPHKAILHVRGRLHDVANNRDYADDAEVTLTNGGWSLFQSAHYKMNNNIVEEINEHLPQASAIMNLVSYSDDYSRSSGSNMLWYRDTGTGAAVSQQYQFSVAGRAAHADAAHTTRAELDADLATVVGNGLNNPNYNQGFALRKAITTGDKDISLFLPLSQIFGSHRDIDTVFMGVKHTYLFKRSRANNYIYRANGVAVGDFVIKHISIWMPKITPSLSVASELEQKLVSGAVRELYFEQHRIYRQTFQAGVTQASWGITSSSTEQLPTYVFVAFQPTTRDDNQEQNPVIFETGNNRISRLSVRINSKTYPENELQVNFAPANRDYARAYMMFQEAMNKYGDIDSGSQVSAEDFASLFPIFAFNVSHHKDQLRYGNPEIEVKWTLSGNFQRTVGGAADNPYNVYALVLSDRYLRLEGMGGKMSVVV